MRVHFLLFLALILPLFGQEVLPLRDQTLQEGARLLLYSGLTESESSTIQWFQDGQLLEGQPGTSLEIDQVGLEDAGQYTFRATNPTGTQTDEATISVTPASPFGGPFIRKWVTNGNNNFYPVTLGDVPFRKAWTAEDATEGWSGAVVVASGRFYRLALDPSDSERLGVESRSALSGDRLWFSPLPPMDRFQVEFQLVWQGGDAYVVAFRRDAPQTDCWRLSGETGEILTTATLDDANPFARERVPVVDETALYFVTFTYDLNVFEHISYLHALDRLTLKPLFEPKAIAMPFTFQAGPELSLADGTLYVMAATRFIAIDGKTGATQWEVDVAEQAPEVLWDVSPPFIDGDDAIVVLSYNQLLGFDLRRKTLAWQREMLGAVTYPIVGNGRINYLTAGPWIQLDRRTGETVMTLDHVEGFLSNDRGVNYLELTGLNEFHAYSDGYAFGTSVNPNGSPLLTAWTVWPKLVVSGLEVFEGLVLGQTFDAEISTSIAGKLALSAPNWVNVERLDDQRLRVFGVVQVDPFPASLVFSLERAGRAVSLVTKPVIVSVNTRPFVGFAETIRRSSSGNSLVLGPSFTDGIPTTISWYKDGQLLPGETGRKLLLGPLKNSDAGEYRVLANNDFGTGEATITVAVTAATVSNGTWSDSGSSPDGRNYMPISGAGETTIVEGVRWKNDDTGLHVVAGGLTASLFIGQETLLEVRAVATGELIWSRVLKEAQLGYGAFVYTEQGRLLTVAGSPNAIEVRAYVLASGEPLWNMALDPGLAQFDEWYLRGNGVFQLLPGDTLTLRKWSAATGALLWERSAAWGDRALMSASDHIDYVVAESRVIALDATTGNTLWEFTGHTSDLYENVSFPAFLGKRLLVTGTSETALLDAVTGEVHWRRPISASYRAVSDSEIFLGSPGVLSAELVHVFDLETGEPLRALGLPDQRFLSGPFVVSADRLYLASERPIDPFDLFRRTYREVAAIDARSGETIAILAREQEWLLTIHDGYLLYQDGSVRRWANLPILESAGERKSYGGLPFRHERRLLGETAKIAQVTAGDTFPEGISVRIAEDGLGLIYEGTPVVTAPLNAWMRSRITLDSGETFWDEWVLSSAVDALPQITPPLTGATLALESGETVTFDWPVEGPGPFAYEWRQDDTVIGTERTLTLSRVAESSSGVYTWTVTNAQGSATFAVTLNVGAIPEAKNSWASQGANLGRTRSVAVPLGDVQSMHQGWSTTFRSYYSEPRTDSERVFVVCDRIDVEEPSASLCAWRLSDGALLWEASLKDITARYTGATTAFVVVDAGQVFVHTFNEDRIGRLLVYEASTGALLWSKVTSASIDGLREPIVDAERVRLNLGEGQSIALAAWDRHTGGSLPALNDILRNHYAASDGDFLSDFDGPWKRIDGNNGRTRWSRERFFANINPIIVDGLALLPNGDAIEVVDWESGELRYTLPPIVETGSHPSVQGGRILLINDGLRTFALSTGKPLANSVRTFEQGSILDAVLTRDHIVALTTRAVEILDQGTLDVLASFPLPPMFPPKIFPVEGGVLVASERTLLFIAVDGSGNRPPSLTLPERALGFEHEPFDFYLSADDDGDSNKLSVATERLPDWLGAEMTSDGRVHLFGRTDASQFFSVTLIVSDEQGAVFRGDLNVLIQEVNDRPLALTGPMITVEEDSEVSAETGDWFDDDEQGASLIYEIKGATPADALVARVEWPRIVLKPAPDFWGDVSAIVLATDSGGLSVANTLQITVLPLPDAPQALSEENVFTYPGETVQEIDLAKLFTDADGDTLRFDIAMAAEEQLIQSLEQRDTNLAIRYTPYLSGETTLTVRAIDPSDLTAELSLKLIVPPFTAPTVAVGAPSLNRQTGLFEQRVTVTNVDPRQLGAFELQMPPASSDARLTNATLTSDELASIRHEQAISPNQTVTLTLRWFSEERRVPSTVPINALAALPSDVLAESVPESSTTVDRIATLEDRSVLVEFSAVPHQRYEVYYSDDGALWRQASSLISAGNRLQWIDQGAPDTWPPPQDVRMRLYRFRQSPN